MANTLSNTGIVTGQTVEALQVSQSVDAFTGANDYDITISGSLTLTGSLLQTGSVFFKQLVDVPATASSNLGAVMIDVDGRLYSGSSSVGSQGTAGEKGENGSQGTTGEKGVDGAQGTTGTQGTVGTTGAAGSQGITGEKGAEGTQGADGVKGSTGEKGTFGEKGEAGAAGAKGEAGEKGVDGEKGADGTQGTNGEKGENGPTGPQGTTGTQGATGEKGAEGTQGETGAGDKGQKGEQGSAGGAGEKGELGPVGPTGTQGTTGTTGTQGTTGQKGEEGTGGGGATSFNSQITYIAKEVSNQHTITLTTSGNVYGGLTWARSSTTLTITSTAHGLTTSDYVVIRNMSADYQYLQIQSVADANTFTLLVADSGGTSGTEGAYIPACRISAITGTTDITAATIAAPTVGNIRINNFLIFAQEQSENMILTVPTGLTNGNGYGTDQTIAPVVFNARTVESSGTAGGLTGGTSYQVQNNQNQITLTGMNNGEKTVGNVIF